MTTTPCFDFMLPDGKAMECFFLDDHGTAVWMDRLRDFNQIRMGEIGRSRNGRPLHGLMVGDGGIYMSITAGAHADEPAGPITACLLAAWLAGSSPEATNLRQYITFMICPQVNPDGAEANKDWFAAVPDFETYLRHVRREGPGDDIEFGYPDLRPENVAVSQFLEAGEPFTFHASLHSMGFAEGAWVLLEKTVAARKSILRREVARALVNSGFKLHDIDRGGEKGFARIAPGFCTTPTGEAMTKYFRQLGDNETAEKFKSSSMDLVLSGNSDAVIVVTELPVFSINGGYVKDQRLPLPPDNTAAPAPGQTKYEQFRDQLKILVAGGDIAGAVDLGKRFDVQPVPFEVQCRVQMEIVRIMAGLM